LSTSSPPRLPSRFTTTCCPYCSFRSTMCLQRHQGRGDTMESARLAPAAPQGRRCRRGGTFSVSVVHNWLCPWPRVGVYGGGHHFLASTITAQQNPTDSS
jgi:hypothetical protein